MGRSKHEMDNLSAQEKIAGQRLSALQLEEVLGNVSKACCRRGISQSQLYEYKRRFHALGLEGLKNLLAIHKRHTQTTQPPEVVEKILTLSPTNPVWGSVRLIVHRKLVGMSVSSQMIQKILIKHGVSWKYECLLKLEEQTLDGKIALTLEQEKAVEKANPCFRERQVESSNPGKLLCQDMFYVEHLKAVGKEYLQAVLDIYGSYASRNLQHGQTAAIA